MSKDFIVYLGETISRDEIYNFIEQSGGFIQDIGKLTQGTIQNAKGVIWIYHDNNLHFDDDELWKLKCDYNILPKTSTIVQLGLDKDNKRSVDLGRDFCKNLLMQYPNSIADDDNGNYFTLDTINGMK